MTTIAGIAAGGKVWLAGDSAISEGDSIDIVLEPKVWVRDGIAFGAAGSLRELQLLRWSLKIPKLAPKPRPDVLCRWLACDFANAARTCLAVDGDSKRETTIMLGVRGWLVVIDSDLSFMRPTSGLAAVGTGDHIALGVLHSTAHMRRPKERLARALSLAAEKTQQTRPPFSYVVA